MTKFALVLQSNVLRKYYHIFRANFTVAKSFSQVFSKFKWCYILPRVRRQVSPDITIRCDTLSNYHFFARRIKKATKVTKNRSLFKFYLKFNREFAINFAGGHFFLRGQNRFSCHASHRLRQSCP